MAAKREFFRMTDVSFFADRYPDKGRWNTIDEAMFPELAVAFSDFAPGGSPVAIEASTHIEKLVAGVKLKGTDAEMEGLLFQRDTFTYYGVVADLRTGREVRRMVTIEGMLGSIKHEAFRKGELAGCDYGINEVLRYVVKEGEKVVMAWDFDDPDSLIIGGRRVYGERAAILNLL